MGILMFFAYVLMGGITACSIWLVGQNKFDLTGDDDDLLFTSGLAGLFWPVTLPALLGIGLVYVAVRPFLTEEKSNEDD